MKITEQYKRFKKLYNKKSLCERTYRRYKEKGWSDEKIALTDLRNGAHFKIKDTIKNRMLAFNKNNNINISYNYYRVREIAGISEDEMLIEIKGGLRKTYNKKNKKEDVKIKKFKDEIKIDYSNIDIGQDDYYLNFTNT